MTRSSGNYAGIYVMLSLLLLCGCIGSRKGERQLAEAEKFIASCPDSTIVILAEMDTTELSEAQKYRRMLLYAYTCVIHGETIPLNSNDLKLGKDMWDNTFSEDEIKWLILKSADAKYRGDFVARIEYLKDAEFLAIQLDSKFNLALIYQYLALVYEQGFNGTVSRYYADKAVNILRELDCPKQLREARMSVVGALSARRDYKTMLDSLLSMKDEVMTNATEGYKIYFLDMLARTYDENNQTREAIQIWDSLTDENQINSNTLAHRARAYWRINELDSAYMLIQQANSLPHNITDEYLCRNVEYGILEKMGRKQELAIVDSLREQASKKVFEERKLEESSLALNQKYDTAARLAWIDAAKARHRTLIMIFVTVIIALVALGVYLYLRKRNQLLRLQHENDVLQIRTLQNNLFENDNHQKAVSSKISELFQSRFNLIDSLAMSYFECRETGQEQKRIYNEVKNSINSFSSEEATHKLEDIVNGYNDNLMEKFKEDFPKLSQAQYRLALYLFCGFSLPSVSIFTGSELRNIYVYKSRLKSTINKSDSPRKDEYLAFFK
ncbi:MAG: hypothetical protein K2H47_00645 [Muribaculaceae bacterium]|nr:hypothetical protein [Muribaculaceae bacterium]